MCVGWLTMRKTILAWDLSFGFRSTGTSESFKNENSFWADGAISNILQNSDQCTIHSIPICLNGHRYKTIIREIKMKQRRYNLRCLTSRRTWDPVPQNSASLQSMTSPPELLALLWTLFLPKCSWSLVICSSWLWMWQGRLFLLSTISRRFWKWCLSDMGFGAILGYL